MRPVESLSKRQREGTPLPFAIYLLATVRVMTGADRVAVLWVRERSVYHALPWVDAWPLSRDARQYRGPWPVVCHPPCGPWGKYRSVSRESARHGLLALALVHRWGGVVEQPLGSTLFKCYGRTPLAGVRQERVCQGHFGHLSLKETLLYWFPSDHRSVHLAGPE